MLRLFCQPYGSSKYQKLGLPILLEPILTHEQLQFPTRNTISEVYEQVEADIENARTMLAESSNQDRVNRYTAIAYLARVAFQQGDYNKAADLVKELLDCGCYSLPDTPQDFFFNEGSEEEIWTIYSTPGDGIEGFGLSSIYHETGPNQAFISDNLRERGYNAIIPLNQLLMIESISYKIVDLRADPGILSEELLISSDTMRTNKYENTWLENEDNTPIARLAEFILMRAEALARINGINSESIDLLNMVRQRSIRIIDGDGVEVSNGKDFISFKMEDFSEPNDLIEVIILERRVELAFEGNYFHDLMRLKRTVQGRPFDAHELRLPIPQRELDVNANLVQNPGY